MTPYETGYLHTLKLAGLAKISVNLKQLRQAGEALKARVPIIRRNVQLEGGVFSPPWLGLRKAREGVPESYGMGPMTIPALSQKQLARQVEQRLAPQLDAAGLTGAARREAVESSAPASGAINAPLLAKGKTTIYQGGSPAALFADELAGGRHPDFNAMRQSGPGQEAFNRWVLRHEGSETAKHFGDRSFMSHLSTRPMLNDLNIAATFEGPGAEAVGAIRALREPEVAEMSKYVPGLERLNLGEQRVSRHAQKRLQEAYERGLAREGVTGIPGLNA